MKALNEVEKSKLQAEPPGMTPRWQQNCPAREPLRLSLELLSKKTLTWMSCDAGIRKLQRLTYTSRYCVLQCGVSSASVSKLLLHTRSWRPDILWSCLPAENSPKGQEDSLHLTFAFTCCMIASYWWKLLIVLIQNSNYKRTGQIELFSFLFSEYRKTHRNQVD